MEDKSDPVSEHSQNDSFDGLRLDQVSAAKILLIWKLRCLRAARSHYAESATYHRKNSVLTMLNALAAVGVGFLSAYSFAVTDQFAVNAISVGAGLMVVLTTIYQYLVRAEYYAQHHKLAANEFSNIQRKIERYLCSNNIKMGLLHNINRDINFVTKAYDAVRPINWRKHSEIETLIKQYESEIDTRFWSALQAVGTQKGRF